MSLKIATEVLCKGGIFLTKVFRSKDYTSLMWLFNQFFEKVEATKPQASRYTSAEIYVICFNYKAPKEIDPKLFEPNFVFEEVSQKKKLKIEFQKKRRNRDGYDEGNYTFFKEAPASKFIDCDNPIYTIVEFQKFHFDDENDKKYLNHPDTTNEIKLLLEDTQLLGRVDFRMLLKWRRNMIDFKNESNENQKMDIEGEEEDIKVLNDYEDIEQNDMENNDKSEKVNENLDEIELEKEIKELKDKTEKFKKNLEKRRKIKEKKRLPLLNHLFEKQSDAIDTYLMLMMSYFLQVMQRFY